jgi:hypothetical protein
MHLDEDFLSDKPATDLIAIWTFRPLIPLLSPLFSAPALSISQDFAALGSASRTTGCALLNLDGRGVAGNESYEIFSSRLLANASGHGHS